MTGKVCRAENTDAQFFSIVKCIKNCSSKFHFIPTSIYLWYQQINNSLYNKNYISENRVDSRISIPDSNTKNERHFILDVYSKYYILQLPVYYLHVRSSSKPNKAEKKVLQQEFKKCNAQFSLLICTRFQSM